MDLCATPSACAGASWRRAGCTDVGPGPADDFFKLLALPRAVLVEFLEVLYALFGFGRCALLKVGGFAEELLGCDLEERGGGASAVYPGGVREECVLTCTAAGARFLTLPEPSRDILGGA